MAHFAQITNNEVTEVIVIANSDIDNLPFPASETVGQTYIASIGISGEWLQTSYNGNFRGSYAGIGYAYDETLDIFVAPIIAPVEQ
jgi:hypothetical protein